MKQQEAHAAMVRITSFNNGYVRLVEAYHEGRPLDVQNEQVELAGISEAVQRDLERVNFGGYLLMNAPAFGGGITPVRITDLMLDHKLTADYNIDPHNLILQLHKALGVYRPYQSGETKDPLFDFVGCLLWPVGVAGVVYRFVLGMDPFVRALLGLGALGAVVWTTIQWIGG